MKVKFLFIIAFLYANISLSQGVTTVNSNEVKDSYKAALNSENINAFQSTGKMKVDASVLSNAFISAPSKEPLYVVNGIIVDGLKGLNPDDVESMTVLKDRNATVAYGDSGKNGVILITLKKGVVIPANIKILPVNSKSQPLYIINGEIVKDYAKLGTIKPSDIESINVLKDESATIKYGDLVKNGAIEIKLKEVASSKEEFDFSKDFKSTKQLLVVDGEIVKDFKGLSPDEIEFFTIFKEEQAIDKYGNAGKNGVVEITLKKK